VCFAGLGVVCVGGWGGWGGWGGGGVGGFLLFLGGGGFEGKKAQKQGRGNTRTGDGGEREKLMHSWTTNDDGPANGFMWLGPYLRKGKRNSKKNNKEKGAGRGASKTKTPTKLVRAESLDFPASRLSYQLGRAGRSGPEKKGGDRGNTQRPGVLSGGEKKRVPSRGWPNEFTGVK